MHRQLPPVRRGTMLEKVDRLPGPEDQPAFNNRDGKLRQRQRSADMGRHVVQTFRTVAIAPRRFRRDPAEKAFKVSEDVRVSILLHQQRGRGVATPHRQQPGRHALVINPLHDAPANVHQPAALRGYLKDSGCLPQGVQRRPVSTGTTLMLL